jgi:hypothetical protein
LGQRASREYSTDGSTWTEAPGVPEFARASGLADYSSNTTVRFGGAFAQYVKLTINSTWGGIPQCGLSEVRFFYVPVQASQPAPAAGATGVDLDAVLSWRPGHEAVSHKVTLGTDRQAVTDGTAPAGTVTKPRYEPASLAYGTTYYWKVSEVNEAATPSAWDSDVWSFTTKEYTAIEDFESYTDDEGSRIYETWVDGWTNNTGSVVGYLQAPFAEPHIIHGARRRCWNTTTRARRITAKPSGPSRRCRTDCQRADTWLYFGRAVRSSRSRPARWSWAAAARTSGTTPISSASPSNASAATARSWPGLTAWAGAIRGRRPA